MAIRLQLENGKTKQYRTSFGIGSTEPYPSDGEHTTLCGKKWPGNPGIKEECDHLDCAIWVSEKGFRTYSRLSLFIIAFGIIVGLFWQGFGRWLMLIEFFIALLYVLTSIKYYYDKLDLKEFSDHGTIDGIKAFKL